jgi:hypothetical protein
LPEGISTVCRISSRFVDNRLAFAKVADVLALEKSPALGSENLALSVAVSSQCMPLDSFEDHVLPGRNDICSDNETLRADCSDALLMRLRAPLSTLIGDVLSILRRAEPERFSR